MPVEDAETKSISFTNAFLPLDAALDAAQVAVRGTVIDSYVVPLDSDEVALYNDDKSLTEDPFLAGRRVFELTVSEVYRGDVKPGDAMRVWYGSELQPGVRAEGSPDSVAEPAVGADVIVLSEPAIDMPYLGTVYLPLEGSGVGTVDEGSVVIEPVTDALEEVARDLVEVEKQLRLPATGAPRSPTR